MTAASPDRDVAIPGLATDRERADTIRARRRGVAHLRALQPRAPRVDEAVVVEMTAGPDAPDGAPWLVAEGDAVPFDALPPEWDTLAWGYVRRYRATIPGRAAGVVHYALGVGDIAADGGARQAYVVGDTGPPAWARDAIVYQVWVDRFAPVAGSGPADRYGGSFAGLTERLDHVAALGVNTIWLNPIHPSSAYHGYEVTDYFDVDPALGGLDDFDRFVAAAHARQLRVVLDFVPSHVSARHPHFEAARSHAESPYVSWFRFQAWPEEYATFFGVETMPQLNHDEPAVRDHLIDAARFWLDRGVDGFRLDYAGGSSYELWAEFRAAVRAHRPDCWLFGEVVDTPDVQRTYEGLFDGCLDFQLSLALRRAFGFGTVRADELARLIDDHEAAFPAHFSRPSFLDNHDLDRIRFISGGDLRRVRIAALCQFALAGPPVVYYGTEVGLSQELSIHGTDDRHARLPMRWDAGLEDSLVPYYRALADLRQELAGAPRTTLAASADRLSFSRGDIVVELDLGELTGVARRGADVLLRA